MIIDLVVIDEEASTSIPIERNEVRKVTSDLKVINIVLINYSYYNRYFKKKTATH